MGIRSTQEIGEASQWMPSSRLWMGFHILSISKTYAESVELLKRMQLILYLFFSGSDA